MLPEDVIDRMVCEIPDARRIDIDGTNHYSILFQPNARRDRAMLEFLKTRSLIPLLDIPEKGKSRFVRWAVAEFLPAAREIPSFCLT